MPIQVHHVLEIAVSKMYLLLLLKTAGAELLDHLGRADCHVINDRAKFGAERHGAHNTRTLYAIVCNDGSVL